MSKSLLAKLATIQNQIAKMKESGNLVLSTRKANKQESNREKIAKLESRIQNFRKENGIGQKTVNRLRELQAEIRAIENKRIESPIEKMEIEIGGFYGKTPNSKNQYWGKTPPTRINENCTTTRIFLSRMSQGNMQIRDYHRVNGNWFAYLQANMKPETLTLIQYRMNRDILISQKIEIAREIETIYLSSAISTPVQESYTYVQTKGKGKGKVSTRNRIVYDSVLSDSDNERVESLYGKLGAISAQIRGLALRNPKRKSKFVPEYHNGKLPNGMTGTQFRNLLKSRAKRLENKRKAEIAKILIERENRKMGLQLVAETKPKTIAEIQAIQSRVESRNERTGESRYYAIQQLSSGEIVCHFTQSGKNPKVYQWVNFTSALKAINCQNLVPARGSKAYREFSKFLKTHKESTIEFSDSAGNRLGIRLSNSEPTDFGKSVKLPKF